MLSSWNQPLAEPDERLTAWRSAQPQCENLTPTTAARPSPTNLEDELMTAGLTDGGAIRVRKLSYPEAVRHQTAIRVLPARCTLP